MIKIKFFFLFFILVSLLGFSQNEVLELPINYKSTFYDHKESLAISNEDTGDLVLFIEDEKSCKLLMLNKDLIFSSQLEIGILPRTFNSFIGYQINNNSNYTLFFTHKNKKKFGVINFDFDSNTSELIELDFKLHRESYVEGITHKNKFYLMSVTKSSSDVHFYMFDAIGNIANKKTVDFSFLNKIETNGFTKKASSYLVSSGFNYSGSLMKMDVNTPNAIEVTSKPNKLYVIDNNFVFTFDTDKDKTLVAILAPSKEFDIILKEFDKPILEPTDLINHNSYLYKEKIYQIVSSPKTLVFTIRDFNSNELLKVLNIKKDEEISFKNTSIIQEGTSFGNKTRTLEDTNKFLRKVSRGDIGIASYFSKGKYKITIGSEIERASGGGFAPMGGFGGIPMGSFGPLSVSFNPTFFAYGGYSSSKSTRIDCLFDNNFKHVKGDISDNVFDRIKAFEELFNNNKKKTTEGSSNLNVEKYSGELELNNLFRHQGKLYFGYINTDDRNYHLIEFID